MIVHTCDQRSPEWFALRAGRLTGSFAADMLATLKVKKGEAACRRDLRVRLALERITGRPISGDYVSAAMQRGTDKEPTARSAYEVTTGNIVRQTGFVAHDSLMVGFSPDGDVDDFGGLVEIKCPNSTTHLDTWRAGTVPPEHLPQVQHALWISGAQWCDFVSFDDRLPSDLALFVVRVQRADVDLAGYELGVRLFLSEVDTEKAAIEALRAEKAVA